MNPNQLYELQSSIQKIAESFSSLNEEEQGVCLTRYGAVVAFNFQGWLGWANSCVLSEEAKIALKKNLDDELFDSRYNVSHARMLLAFLEECSIQQSIDDYRLMIEVNTRFSCGFENPRERSLYGMAIITAFESTFDDIFCNSLEEYARKRGVIKSDYLQAHGGVDESGVSLEFVHANLCKEGLAAEYGLHEKSVADSVLKRAFNDVRYFYTKIFLIADSNIL